jgi:hypothetical protein
MVVAPPKDKFAKLCEEFIMNFVIITHANLNHKGVFEEICGTVQ